MASGAGKAGDVPPVLDGARLAVLAPRRPRSRIPVPLPTPLGKRESFTSLGHCPRSFAKVVSAPTPICSRQPPGPPREGGRPSAATQEEPEEGSATPASPGARPEVIGPSAGRTPEESGGRAPRADDLETTRARAERLRAEGRPPRA